MQSNSRPKTVFSFNMTSLATAANPVAVSHRAQGPSHFLFEKEEKKNPQSWGNPQGKICLGGRDLWKFWRKVLTVRDVHALCNSKHEEKKKRHKNWGFQTSSETILLT